MAKYAVMNPGKYHLGKPFNFPPIQNRTYDEDNMIFDIKWKTSAYINRRVYLGNVKITYKDGKTKLLTDSIFKSKASKFDSFTLDGRIDVAIGDGEDIIRLAGYADRLLQFKQNTLHIINVNKGQEFLEATHKFKGISHHNAVCEFDYGVAFCNAHGIYLYDGQQISELFVKQGIRLISEADWTSFYKEGETMVGYIPNKKQLLFVKGVTGNDSGDIMIYDLITQSFTKGTGRLGVTDKTNLINMWDNQLIHGYETTSNSGTITVKPWKSIGSVAVNNFKVESKDFNFGTESKKKVSKVRITYKGANGSNLNILPKYSINGGDFTHSFKDSAGSNITNIAGSSNWTEIDLYTDSNANNIRSFAFQLTDVSGQDVASDFQINDVTIIYRRKSVK
tara:strand:+ start:4266 stop:5444 length:1179 start_codon:yes stop_codon:yes gene_type:complete